MNSGKKFSRTQHKVQKFKTRRGEGPVHASTQGFKKYSIPIASGSEEFAERFAADFIEVAKETDPQLAESLFGLSAELIRKTAYASFENIAKLDIEIAGARDLLGNLRRVTSAGLREPTVSIAENMQRSIDALGPALAGMETPVSPQLARSIAATENTWLKINEEFGLLSSLEVSELVGSKSPNRSYASEQRSKGRLLAVKRLNEFRYPGFQFDRTERTILPIMAELLSIAKKAGRSETSLSLWMVSPSGYLDGERPVDQLSHTDKVLYAAEQSFGVQW